MPPGPWIAFIGGGWLLEEAPWMSQLSGCVPNALLEFATDLGPEPNHAIHLNLGHPELKELQATASLHCSISGPWRQLWDDTRRWVETFPDAKVSWSDLLANTDGWVVPKTPVPDELESPPSQGQES